MKRKLAFTREQLEAASRCATLQDAASLLGASTVRNRLIEAGLYTFTMSSRAERGLQNKPVRWVKEKCDALRALRALGVSVGTLAKQEHVSRAMIHWALKRFAD